MMTQSTSYSIVIMTALLTSALSHPSTENVYCVTLTATSCSSCPHNSTNCTTLSEYAQEAELYFTSDTTMVFLPGNHTLDTNITVVSVSQADHARRVFLGRQCTNSCLQWVSWLQLHKYGGHYKYTSLAFTSCSRDYTLPDIPLAIVKYSTAFCNLGRIC